MPFALFVEIGQIERFEDQTKLAKYALIKLESEQSLKLISRKMLVSDKTRKSDILILVFS